MILTINIKEMLIRGLKLKLIIFSLIRLLIYFKNLLINKKVDKEDIYFANGKSVTFTHIGNTNSS